LAAEFARRGINLHGSNLNAQQEEGEEIEPFGFSNKWKPLASSTAAVTIDTMHVETLKGEDLSLESIQKLHDANIYKKSTGQKNFDIKLFFAVCAWRKITTWCLSAKTEGIENPMTVAELKAAEDEIFFAYLKQYAH
jgi:hypothetical protein